MNIIDIELDINKESAVIPVVRIGQGDSSGTTIRATIYDNGAQVDVSSFSAMFEMRLPDGETYVRDGSCEVTGGVITYVVDEQHCASVVGITDDAYFDIMDGAKVVYSTSRFRVHVLRSAHDGAEPAESWDNAVDEIIRKGSAAIANENERIAAELARKTAEEARVNAEESREAAEELRENNQALWGYAEDVRNTDEFERNRAEGERQSAESSRATAEAQRVAEFAIMEQRSKGWLRYYCTEPGEEYDEDTRMPIVPDPDESTLYYVPAENPTQDNQWVEWQYDTSGDRWEMQGTTEATISPVTTQQIDAIASDGTVTSSNVLNGSGLTYLWAKLKAKFAALTHSHAVSDVTGLQTALDGKAASSHDHSGDALAPASVTASGTVKAATIEDSGGTLAALRESVSRAVVGSNGIASANVQYENAYKQLAFNLRGAIITDYGTASAVQLVFRNSSTPQIIVQAEIDGAWHQLFKLPQ